MLWTPSNISATWGGARAMSHKMSVSWNTENYLNEFLCAFRDGPKRFVKAPRVLCASDNINHIYCC